MGFQRHLPIPHHQWFQWQSRKIHWRKNRWAYFLYLVIMFKRLPQNFKGKKTNIHYKLFLTLKLNEKINRKNLNSMKKNWRSLFTLPNPSPSWSNSIKELTGEINPLILLSKSLVFFCEYCLYILINAKRKRDE